MKTFLTRIVSDIRVWLGWDDSSTGWAEALTPRFGWLLPEPSLLVARRSAPVQQLVPAVECSLKLRG